MLPLKVATVLTETHKHLEDLPGWCNTDQLNANLLPALWRTSVLGVLAEVHALDACLCSR